MSQVCFGGGGGKGLMEPQSADALEECVFIVRTLIDGIWT